METNSHTWDLKVRTEDDWWIKKLITIKMYVQVLWVEQKGIFYQTYQEI